MSGARWMQDCVREFHQATDNPAPDKLDLEGTRLELRVNLIMEEALETVGAMGYSVAVAPTTTYPDEGRKRGHATCVKRVGPPNWPGVIDGLCDLTYVTLGTAVEMGLELLPFFHAVHASNMKKIGGPVREDGKTLKPEGWKPPPIKYLLDRLIARDSAR